MSRITKTKLNRAKFRDGKKMLDGFKITIQRIIGYLPVAKRQWADVTKDGEIKVLMSEGQIINGRKFINRLVSKRRKQSLDFITKTKNEKK